QWQALLTSIDQSIADQQWHDAFSALQTALTVEMPVDHPALLTRRQMVGQHLIDTAQAALDHGRLANAEAALTQSATLLLADDHRLLALQADLQLQRQRAARYLQSARTDLQNGQLELARADVDQALKIDSDPAVLELSNAIQAQTHAARAQQAERDE